MTASTSTSTSSTPAVDPAVDVAAAASTDPIDPVEVEQMLVEEVSIDGLCGVY